METLATSSSDGPRPAPSGAERPPFVFPAVCLTADAEPLRIVLLTELDADPSLRLDLSSVAEADVSLLQILLAAERSAQARGGRLTLEEPLSQPVQSLIAEIGQRRGGRPLLDLGCGVSTA